MDNKKLKLGVLKDIKNGENRVVLTPAEIKILADEGHDVTVASGAGCKAGFPDETYEAAGAKLVKTNDEIWESCDFIAKVKEIEPSEYDKIREGQMIICCIHPAAHREEVDVLLDKKVIAITAEDSHRYGSPNCEAAGKAGAFMGLWALMCNQGGMGKFVNGVGSSNPVKALVCGAGIVGRAAIDTLVRLGADVTVSERRDEAQSTIKDTYQSVRTVRYTQDNLERELPNMDLVLNCVRWPKDATDYMITRKMVSTMKHGSVICDISNDYGCIETFRETTHDDPIYIEENVVHYCVNNIPGAIAKSTSVAYGQAMLEHIQAILKHGLEEACINDGYLRRSLTCYKGYLTHEETSGIQGRPWVRPEVVLGIEKEELDPAPPATRTVSDNFYSDVKL